jgi:hypothetical protein
MGRGKSFRGRRNRGRGSRERKAIGMKMSPPVLDTL